MLFKVKDNGFSPEFKQITTQTANFELIPKSSLCQVFGLSYLCH